MTESHNQRELLLHIDNSQPLLTWALSMLQRAAEEVSLMIELDNEVRYWISNSHRLYHEERRPFGQVTASTYGNQLQVDGCRLWECCSLNDINWTEITDHLVQSYADHREISFDDAKAELLARTLSSRLRRFYKTTA